MNNMQNGAADTQQKINDLLQQYKDSHDSSQKNELRDQLADLYKTKDDWDQRFYDTRKELRQLGLDPDAPTGPGAPAPDGNGNPDKNGGTLAGQNLGNNQTPGQGGGQPGQPNDGQSGMDGNTAQSGQPNPPGAGNPLDGTLTGQLVNLEPAMGDGGNGNIPFLPPLLNGYMAGFDKDRSDQTGSAFVNMQAQAKGQQIAGIPDDVYRQILNQLNTAGNDADNTRNAAATAAAQQQDTTSWGNTVGNAFVDSVTAGGTAMGQTFGGAAAGQVSKFVQDAVSGGPRGGDGGGNGGGGDQAPASGGAGANTAGGGNSTCNDGDKGAGGGGVPPDLNNLGAQAGAQVAGALVGATTLAAGGVKPTADNIKNFTDQNGGGTTGQGGNTPGPQAPTPVKPATTPKPAKPPSSNSQGCICFLDGDHFGSMHYFFGCRVTGKNSSGASFDAKHPVPQPSKCPQCGGSISLFKDIANTVPPPDFSNLKAPEPMKNPSWDQIRNVLDIK